MSFVLRNHKARWLVTGLSLLSVFACRVAQVVPATQIVEVTRVVPVTQLVQVPTVEVTRLILVAPIVEVTRIVEVIKTVEVPLAVEAPAPTMPTEAPEPTEAPPPTEAPKPTEAPQPTANDSLLVWYDFEDNFLTAGSVADHSGNGNDAQMVGTIDIAEGISGGHAIFFTGNGYIQARSNPAAGRNKVSFSLWFKTDHPENNYKLASAAWWNGGPGSGWILATHIPEFWSEDTNGLYLPDISNEDNHFPSGEWVHEVVTYDGHRIKEYTNGQLVNDWPTTGEAIGQGLPMAVGAWPSFQGYNFQGSIDEFRMYNRALTLKEVQALYNQR